MLCVTDAGGGSRDIAQGVMTFLCYWKVLLICLNPFNENKANQSLVSLNGPFFLPFPICSLLYMLPAVDR